STDSCRLPPSALSHLRVYRSHHRRRLVKDIPHSVPVRHEPPRPQLILVPILKQRRIVKAKELFSVSIPAQFEPGPTAAETMEKTPEVPVPIPRERQDRHPLAMILGQIGAGIEVSGLGLVLRRALRRLSRHGSCLFRFRQRWLA